MKFDISCMKMYPGGKDWVWSAIGLDGSILGSGDADSLKAARQDLKDWFQILYGFALEGLCQCGGTAVGMKAHEPGHSHWCLVAPCNLVVTQE